MSTYTKKFIFLVRGDLYLAMFKDLQAAENVSLIDVKHFYAKKPNGNNVFKRIVNKCVFHHRIANKTLPAYTCCRLFGKRCVWGIAKNKSIEYNIVIHSGFLAHVPLSTFSFLKKIGGGKLKLSLLLLNSWNASSPQLESVKHMINNPLWDCVYTFDKEDATRFGWQYIGLHYWSKPDLPVASGMEDFDLYFVGGLKGDRERLILDVLATAEANSVRCRFDLSAQYHDGDVEKYAALAKSANVYKWFLPYNDCLGKTTAANCILEILQEKQHQQSLRYFEAVAFNKKLLTNNKNIKDLPFYNERYMRYFETANDIDWEWVKEKESIDYGYSDEFSPVPLLKIIGNGNDEKI